MVCESLSLLHRQGAGRACECDRGGIHKRSGRYATCQMREIHPERFDFFGRHATARKVLLDPAGRLGFSRVHPDCGTRRRRGAGSGFPDRRYDGLPPAWKPRADLLLSLSPMTFPHELARAMLAEQIYRALPHCGGIPILDSAFSPAWLGVRHTE